MMDNEVLCFTMPKTLLADMLMISEMAEQPAEVRQSRNKMLV